MQNRYAKYRLGAQEEEDKPYTIKGPPDLTRPYDTAKAANDAAASVYSPAKAQADARAAAAGATIAESNVGKAAIERQTAEQEAATRAEADRQKLWNGRNRGRTVLETLGQMRGKLSDKSTGVVGQALSYIGGTDATDLTRLADTVRGNLSFEELQKMRDASKTGGALGSITERELELLSATVASLDIEQSKEQLAKQIAKVERHYKRALLSLEGVDPDSFKFDPFEVLDPETARSRAQALISQGADEKTVSEFLRIQDMNFDPEEVKRAVREGRGRVVDGQPSIGLGIQKGAEHVGSRAAEGVQEVANFALGTDFDFGTDWRNSIDRRFDGVYTDPSGETLGKFAASLPAGLISSPVAAGAAAGMLMGESRDLQGVIGEGAMGAAGGYLADKAVRVGANIFAPKIDDAARNLSNRQVRMTPGQYMGRDINRAEEVRTSLPFVGPRIERQRNQSLDDYSYAVQDEVLAPIGGEANRQIAPGNRGVADARRQVGEAYESILSSTSYEWSPGTGNKMLSILGSRRLRPDVAKEVAETIQTEIGNTFANGQRISGREWKSLDEQLGAMVEHYRKEGGPSRRAADALRDIKRTLFNDFVKQNGKRAADIRRADRAHQRMRVYSKAAVADKANGTPTPNQILNAATTEAPYGRVALSEGRAPLQSLGQDGQNVLPQGYANSRSSDRFNASVLNPLPYAQGAALAPLYSEPAQRAMQNVMMREPGRVSASIGNVMHRFPPGAAGMFGASAAPRMMYGDNGAYDPALTEEEYRRLAW